MKRSICLLIASIVGFCIVCMSIAGEIVFLGSGITTRLVWAATILALSGYCFNAKPAAVLAGAVFAALSVIDNNPLVIYWVPCMLCFAGWSHIRHAEREASTCDMQVELEEDFEKLHSRMDKIISMLGGENAEQQETKNETENEALGEKNKNFDVDAYITKINGKRGLKNWWYFEETSTKVLIIIGAVMAVGACVAWIALAL